MVQTTSITIDIAQPGVLPRVYAVQGEKESRSILFTILEDGVDWVPGGNPVAQAHYRRADGTGGSYVKLADGTSAVSAIGNIVELALTEGVCAKAGPVTLTVELSLDNSVIATWPIVVQVLPNPGAQDPIDYVEATKWPGNMFLGTDEKGNVVAKEAPAGGEAVEQPVSMDLSGYEAGTIVLKYADGGVMNVAVEFDADGNPIKFSNGAEEFTVTWPAEVAADG